MSDLDRAIWAARAQLAESDATIELPATERAVAFSDDLWISDERLLVRAFIRPGRAGTLAIDLRDSSTAISGLGCIDASDVRFAASCAVADTLDMPPNAGIARSLEIEIEERSWVGAPEATHDACARLFAISRVYDAVSGALALAWPELGRAGSCSLGAIVAAQAMSGDDALVAVVPGGRGASAREAGQAAWPGPMMPAGTIARSSGATLEIAPRPESAGGGARVGGDGCRATLHVHAPMRVRIAIDRMRNPPHGLDRAGPPEPATLARLVADGTPAELRPWTWTELAAGERIELATAGGAGHGFGGWGIDFEWE